MTTTAAYPQQDSRAGTRWLFGLFAALFAVSLIVHQVWWGGFELLSPHAVVVLAAAWVLLRPTAVGRLAAMLVAEVVAVALDMPFVGSHTVLVLVTSAALLAHLAGTVLGGRRPRPAAVFEAVAPFLRLSLVVMYACAALAKLNSSFLDPATSCAASMSRQVAWFDPTLLDGAWRIEPAVFGTIGVEVALPVLLALRRTRALGLGVGVAFHTVLALAGNVPFTTLAFAFYVAFLPPDTLSRVRRLLGGRWSASARWSARARWGAVRVLALGVFVVGWLAAAAATRTDPAAVAADIALGARLVAVLMALAAVPLLLACARRGTDPTPAGSLRVRHPVLVVGVLLLVLNGLSPYLGLKTDSSFEMFSGLRTEPGAWNHLLVPEAVRVFGAEDGAVRVVATDVPGLLARTAGGTRLVPFELERALRSRPGSVAVVTSDADPAPRTVGPFPAGPTLAERIAVFRDVPPPGPPRC